MKNIRPKEIIKMKQFIREPVDSITEEISENSSKRIILNGGRGTGKSVILNNMEDKGIGTENQTILMQFDSIISFSTTSPNEYFDEKFFEHYYEAAFSRRLLSYMKKNYALTYESNFENIEVLLKNIVTDTINYINTIWLEETKLQRYLSTNEISAEIIEKFKRYIGVDKLNLAINHFDWINGASAYTQQIISKYFDLFDKTIITTDDVLLENRNRQKELEKKGYSFITPVYGKKLNVVKQIIRERIRLYNKQLDNSVMPFDENVMTNKIYKNLINKSNGNIQLMLDTLSNIIELLELEQTKVENLEDEFDNEANERLSYLKKLERMDGTPPRLHL